MTTQKISQAVNGVDVRQLKSVVGDLERDPTLGLCHFRARNRWMGGGHNRITIQDFYALGGEDTSRTDAFVHDTDEPPALAGENQGANPVEFVLSGLSACLFLLGVSRILLLWQDVPARLLPRELGAPGLYGSPVAWGLLASPGDLFLTGLAIYLACCTLRRYGASLDTHQP